MDAKISQNIWSDPRFETACNDRRVAFFWIRTCSCRTISGIVQATPRRFANETGCDMGELKKTAQQWPELFAIVQDPNTGGELVFIRNFIREEFGSGPKLVKSNCFNAIIRSVKTLHQEVQRAVVSEYPELAPFLTLTQSADSACKPLAQPLSIGPVEAPVDRSKSASASVECTVQSTQGECEGEQDPPTDPELDRLPSLFHGPDAAPPSPITPRNYRRARTRDLARDVILPHLVAKTEREYKPVDSNLDLIAARLEEVDLDTEGVKEMIDRQCARWKTDEKMSEYLRVTTLFNKTKFHEYYSARHFPIVQNRQPDHSKGF